VIYIKRVYPPSQHGEGIHFLVDRLWPRGLKKSDFHYNAWFGEVAPSDGLRGWYKHDPDKWEEFKRRYFAELDEKPDIWKPILDAARKGNITLLYSAKNESHNNAVALKIYLESKSYKCLLQSMPCRRLRELPATLLLSLPTPSITGRSTAGK